MRILVAGGAGDIGRYIVRDFCNHGHEVRVLDRVLTPIDDLRSSQVDLLTGSLEDEDLAKRAVNGIEAVVHLAWSFSDQPREIFGGDLVGHINLLEAAVAAKVISFIYTSTATVYGRATTQPVREDHPCLIDEAHKPLYALGKFAAEELCRLYYRDHGLPITVFRFWWAFGDKIGGRHLRNLVQMALKGEFIQVPAGAGGTFVSMGDLTMTCHMVLAGKGVGQIYNLGSLFLSWEEVAGLIIKLTGSTSKLQVIPSAEWRGPAFLNEVWDLSWEKAARELGYQPKSTGSQGQLAFCKALEQCVQEVRMASLRDCHSS